MIAPVLKGNCVYANGRYNLFFTLSEKENGYMYNYVAYVFTDDFKTFYADEVI